MPPAEELLERLKSRSKEKYVPFYWLAVIYDGLGEGDQAFRWFEKAFDERFSWPVWIAVEPRFDRLRSDPRFKSLPHRMKLG